ncbi:hypothetical protein [Spiroplasma phoeniceum]|uniref:Spiroplasma plectrovirus-related protein n=1 Tax=Spiroplasma phoeniceum P40 TaxID=1276259 RepID=A0A345DPY1_9MOLU|nr:hypothetical protein [Spiroplasma phoeniceum]AXF96269.1 spiroplasma plectrovirus-related protein [Spiroplasma phoeniceum P40]
MNVNINAYNRLTGENLYKPYINPDCYINQKYYVKKVYYSPYIKTVVLPLECINSFGKGNPTGIKNTGENETKLLNSRVRSQRNCIQKAIHNFNGCQNLGVETTYILYFWFLQFWKVNFFNFFNWGVEIMQTKQYFILRFLVKKYGKDNVINTVNKIAKDIEIKK